jgi:hypothetical protein
MAEIVLQELCEQGQSELVATRYLEAVEILGRAEHLAWEARSFDTLARLYLPLQEARRQIRQRCGEGAVLMHLFPSNANESIDPQQVLKETPHGQLLAGGWESIAPALEIRRLAKEQKLYVETFLGSVQADPNGQPIIRIVPVAEWTGECVILKPGELPADSAIGTAETFAAVMAIWEQLHAPFLTAAEKEPDRVRRMEAYRFTLRVDPACELAHQFLAEIARELARE